MANGALLIFDEVMTGFRSPAAEHNTFTEFGPISPLLAKLSVAACRLEHLVAARKSWISFRPMGWFIRRERFQEIRSQWPPGWRNCGNSANRWLEITGRTRGGIRERVGRA